MSFNQIKVKLCSHWGDDRNAAEAAWASSTDESKLSTKTLTDVTRVVTGLVNLHHDTPKERCWLEFFITCPIFVERQFDKYRMTVQFQDFEMTYLLGKMGRNNITQNELSGRYRTIPDRPYTLPEDVSILLEKTYGSLKDPLVASKATWDRALEFQHEFYNEQLQALKEAERREVITNAEYKRAREVLRGILGTAYLTDMRIVMNVNAFEHVINQRLATDAQIESRIVAYFMVKEVIASGVCATLITEMIKVNNWAVLLDEVEKIIKGDE